MKASGGGAPSPDPLGKGAATAPGPVWIINSSRQHAAPPGEPREVQVVLTSPRICTQGLWRGLAGGVAQRPQPPPRLPGALGLVLFQFPLERGARRGGRCPGGSRDMKRGGFLGFLGSLHSKTPAVPTGEPGTSRRGRCARGEPREMPIKSLRMSPAPLPSPVGTCPSVLQWPYRCRVPAQSSGVGSWGKRGRRREGTRSFLQPAPATRLAEGLGGKLG